MYINRYIIVKIKGNDKATQRIKCVVSDTISLTYNIYATPIKQLKQYFDIDFEAYVIDNQGVKHDGIISLTYNTNDKRCQVTQVDTNKWKLCNQVVDKGNPFILHLSNNDYNLTKDISLDLVASF